MSEILIHDTERRLLICRGCQCGVTPRAIEIARHLAMYHKGIPLEERQALKERYQDINAINPEDLEQSLSTQTALGQAEELGFHPDLECQQGWACGVDKCVALTTSESEAKRHCRAAHKGTGEPILREVYISTIFRGRYCHYFEVRPPVTVEAVVDNAYEESLRAYEAQCQRYRESLTKIPETDEGRLSLWHRRTGWFDWFSGLDMAKLCQLVSLERSSDEQWLAVDTVRSMVQRMVRRHHDQLGQMSPLVRRHLYSVEVGVNDTPMNPVREEATLKDYTRLWEKFILFILRVGQWTEEERKAYRIEYTPQQLAKSLEICQCPDGALVEPALTELSRLILQQQPGWTGRQSPLLFFLGIVGFNPERKAWRSAQESGPTLSRVIYLLRLFGLGVVLEGPEDDMIGQLQAYRSRFLVNGCEGVFDEVLNQLKLVTVVAQDWYTHPSVSWAQDRQTLWHEGHKIEIAELGRWVEGMITEAEQILCDELLGRDPTFLIEREPGLFIDNLTWANNGDSLVEQNGGLRGGVKRMTDHRTGQYWDQIWLKADWERKLGKCWFKKRWRPLKLIQTVWQQYEASLERFLQLLALIFLLAGGLPPRGPELMSTQWRNSQSILRSWFVVDGKLVAISEYNKSETRTGRPKVIARFYPAVVGRMAVCLMADIWPFADFLRVMAGEEVSGVPWVWHRRGTRWTTTTVSDLLAQRSSLALGTRLTVQSWRHVAIAIDQEKCRSDGTAQPSLAVNHAFQAGHSLQLEEHHYALTTDMLCGTSAKTLLEFADISWRWQQVLGLQAPSPVASRKRKRRRESEAWDQELEGPSSRLDGQPLNLEHQAKRPMIGFRESLPPTRPTLTISQPEESPLKVLQQLYGADASFRSPSQQEAVEKMVMSQDDLVVQQPTGSGKSLLIELSAALAPGRVIIVLVPYLTLRDDLVRRCRKRGITAQAFVPGQVGSVSVMLLTPEMAITTAFINYRINLALQGLIQRVFFDECHLIAMEDHRPWAALLAGWTDPGIQRVFMTATLPGDVYRPLAEMARLKPGRVQRVIAPVNIPTLRWEVIVQQDKNYDRTVEALVPQGQKVLIFVMAKVDGHRLQSKFGWPFFHAGLEDRGQAMLDTFMQSDRATLCATTAAGTGWDIEADLVILFGGTFDLVTAVQQAGRSARCGRQGRCVLLTGNRRNSKRPGQVALQNLIETTLCRRVAIASYLDPEWRLECIMDEDKCDICERKSNPTLEGDKVNGQRPLHLVPTSSPNLSSEVDLPEELSHASMKEPHHSWTSSTTLSTSFELVHSELSIESPLTAVAEPGAGRDQMQRALKDAGWEPNSKTSIRDMLSTVYKSWERDHVKCYFCWFHKHHNHSDHLWASCSFREASIPMVTWAMMDGLKLAIKKYLHQDKSFGKRIHFNCILPLQRLHSRNESSDFRKDCPLTGSLLFVIELGMRDKLIGPRVFQIWKLLATDDEKVKARGLSIWLRECDNELMAWYVFLFVIGLQRTR